VRPSVGENGDVLLTQLVDAAGDAKRHTVPL
jgi:hypothetical protein